MRIADGEIMSERGRYEETERDKEYNRVLKKA
jgi:hypothetical protein